MSLYKIIKNFYDNIGTSGVLLGIDYGQKKIGLSISDSMRQLAFAHQIIQHTHDHKIFDLSRNIIESKNISGIVIGFPLQLNGEEGTTCKQVIIFCEQLSKVIDLPTFLQDERFSTKLVRQNMLMTGMKSQNKQLFEDKLAAANILQTTLDQLNFLSSKNLPPPPMIDM